ncbi:MAG TPA: flavodoxin family protein [Spirochaetota bacterium]|mgnify:CR=1 FL=1|nr:flavodoxin family protein [Spirochaetota bacterium]
MKILILNGNPDASDTGLDAYIAELGSRLAESGNDAELVTLREKKIRPCTGCFGCWIKTPGTCSIPDDAIELAGRYLAADVVILASPLVNGYLSSLLKNAIDRNIPIIHPYLEAVDGEVHHLKRYDRYPEIGILLQREPSTDEEDIEIVTDLFKRMIINMRTTLKFLEFTDKPAPEVAHAVNIH